MGYLLKKKSNLKKKLYKYLKKKNINYWERFSRFRTFKASLAYAKVELSGPQYGPFIQKLIIKKNYWTKILAKELKGDFKTTLGVYIELKISLGTIKCNKFNFGQIRLQHEVDFYILIAYYVSDSNWNKLGEVFIFKLKKNEISAFIGNCYSHGTINGWNDLDSKIIEKHSEKSIGVSYNSIAWKKLLKFRISQNFFFSM